MYSAWSVTPSLHIRKAPVAVCPYTAVQPLPTFRNQFVPVHTDTFKLKACMPSSSFVTEYIPESLAAVGELLASVVHVCAVYP